MAQCEGTTKAGARCKRTAPEGERFCSIHAGQEQSRTRGETGVQGKGSGEGRSRTTKETGPKQKKETGPKEKARAKTGSSSRGDDQDRGDSRWDRFPGSRHLESPEDVLHVAVGVLATVALFWLLRRGPKLPGS